MLLFGGLRRTGCASGPLFAISLLLLPAFGILVGGRPPVLRAVAASMLLLLGRWRGREGNALNSLALIAALFLIVMPRLLLDAGFQLTFMATAGIMLFAKRISARLPLPRKIALPAALSASAYIGCAPILAQHFGWLAPIALLSNLAAAPLCAAMIVGGYGAILLDWLPPVQKMAAILSLTSVSMLENIAEFAGRLPFAGWRVPSPGLLFSLTYYLLFARLAIRRRSHPILYALLLLLLVSLHTGGPPPGPKDLRAAVLDVGQAQCVVLEGRAGVALIDAAGSPSPRFDPGERIILPYLASRGIRRIDLLALSHGDIDHAGGAFAILRETEVGSLWMPPGYHAHPILEALAASAHSAGTAVVLAERGTCDLEIGAPIQVLAPGRNERRLEANDRSLVVRAGRSPCRLLIPGDLELAGEEALAASRADARGEALVVAHHGSSGGSGARFLAAVGPLHAVVSCGFNNRYGHPGKEVLRRLDEAGAALYRTDEQGMVLLECEPDGWRVRTTRRRKRRAAE
jgi:competence protein ComEC